MKFRAILASTLVVFAFKANAAQPQPPGIESPLKGGTCSTNNFTGADTVFNCEHIGQVKIREIYEKGWRVVDRVVYPTGFNIHVLIIEEQKR